MNRHEITLLKRALLLALAAMTLLASFASCSRPDNETPAETTGEPIEDFVYTDVDYYDAEPLYEYLSKEDATVTSAEIERMHTWFEDNMLCVEEGKAPAFTFTYGGANLSTNMNQWTPKVTKSDSADGAESTYLIELTHKTDAVKVTCEAVLYHHFPSVKWTVYVTNTGSGDSRLLEGLTGLSHVFEMGDGSFDIQYNKGSADTTTDFLPLVGTLSKGRQTSFAARTGRASYQYLPFFNVIGEDVNLMYGIGWPGQWNSLVANVNGDAQITIKQEELSGKLRAGETVRSPQVYLQFTEGQSIKSNNVFRRWAEEKLYVSRQKPIFGTGAILPAGKNSEQGMAEQVDRMTGRKDFGADYFWGKEFWFELNNGTWIESTGNWYPNTETFTTDMSLIQAALERQGMGYILWFEPERVMPNTYLYNTYPQHLLTPGANTNGSNYGTRWRLWDFSDDEATEVMCQFIDEKIKTYGVSIYRQDFNTDPLNFWTQKDKTDGRKGFTENKYVVNFLSFWDYLLENNPGLIIDNCASGGRRICLETLSRSLILWRDDLCHDPIANQNQNYGLHHWVSYQGTQMPIREVVDKKAFLNGEADYAIYSSLYLMRSAWSTNYTCLYDYQNDTIQAGTYGANLDIYKEIQSFFKEDYYPLTSLTVANCEKTDVVVAEQYNRPADDSGMVYIAQRQGVEEKYVKLRLYGLDPAKRYAFTDADGSFDTIVTTGEDAMTNGVIFRSNRASKTAVVRIYTYTAVD